MNKIYCESTNKYITQGSDFVKYKVTGQTKTVGSTRCAVLVHTDSGKTYLKPWDAFPSSIVRKKGESNPFSKLNNLKVRTLIRDFYTHEFTEESFNEKILAYSKLYNVSSDTILSVVNGKSWRHITVNYIKQLENGNSKVAENLISAANKVKGNNKLSANLAKFIVRDFYLHRISAESLSKKYCVSESTIKKVVTGKLWKEVTIPAIKEYSVWSSK